MNQDANTTNQTSLNSTSLNKLSFLSEIQTNVENKFASWHIAWLGKVVCSPIMYFILFYLCIASNALYWQVHVYNFTGQKELRYFNGQDTNSYCNAPHNLLKGETDLYRTPIYPFFIDSITKIFSNEKILVGSPLFDKNNKLIIDTCNSLLQGWKPYLAVVTIQLFIYMCTLIFFFFATKNLINNSIFHFLFLLYVANYFIPYHFWVMTESLAISGTLCFFSLLVYYLKGKSTVIASCLSLFTLTLVMLRPAFILLIVLLFLFWVLRFLMYKSERKSIFMGLLCLAISCLVTHGYCTLNKKNYGIYQLSSVETANKFMIIYRTNLYENNQNDKDIIDYILAYNNKTCSTDINHYYLYGKLVKRFGYTHMKTFIDTTLKENFGSYLITTVKRMYWERYQDNYMNYYIILFFDCITIIFLSLKYKVFPWLRLCMWGFLLCSVLLAFLGSYDCHARLIVPALPIYLIIIARYIDFLLIAYRKTRDDVRIYLKSTL